MKKRLFVIIPFLLVFMLNFVVYTPVSAYLASSSLIPSNTTTTSTITCDSNGIILIQDYLRTNVDRSMMPGSDKPLVFHEFVSGTWQGQDVSSLSSLRFCDQSSTVGFSHSVSLVSSGSYFVYFVQIALPVVAGDTFTFKRAYSEYAVSTAQRSFYTFLPGVSGVRKCFISSGLVTSGSSFNFTLPSDNQFYFVCFSADSYKSNFSSVSNQLLFKSQSGTYNYFSDLSNLTYVCSNSFVSISTSNYGLHKGDSLSFNLQDDLTAYCVAGFEIYSDGSFYPGLDDSSHLGGDSDSGSGGSTDLSSVNSRLDEIIALLESGGSGFSPAEFWEVYKSGLEELFGIEDSEPAEPPPEDSEQETTEPTTIPFDVGIDEEQVDEALSYLSTDLGDTVTGSGGALSFFWFITDRFLTSCDLYVVAGLSLMFCLGCWILRS